MIGPRLGIIGGLALALALGPGAQVAARGPAVLRVGTWHGIAGQYASVQSAVDAAQPGDWILVGPGDYHEEGSALAGVEITKPSIHLRGMDRNSTVVDGTLPGRSECDPAQSAQNFGIVNHGQPGGRNGILVKPQSRGSADGVTIENLTVCNFLSDASGGQGNGVWFNGGDGTGHQWLGAFGAAYLTVTTTYSDPSGGAPTPQYGVFASNTYGPGLITQSYASNVADAAFYVGGCPDCNVTLDHVHGEHNGQGYSGSNDGGHLVISSSEFNDNIRGIGFSSINFDDPPPPQDGACPNGGGGPGGAATCIVIRGNSIHDNNNPSVPRGSFGGRATAGIGTGILVAGGRNDTIIDNTVSRNGLFGIAVADYPDTGTPAPTANCQGGVSLPGVVCYFQAFGNEVAHNVLDGNGFFANNGDADLGDGTTSVTPGNCFHDNTTPSGAEPTSSPPAIQTVDGRCGGPTVGDPRIGVQIACSGVIQNAAGVDCPGMSYPTATGVTLLARKAEPTMPDPCAGVPPNPWCAETAATGLPGTGARSPSSGGLVALVVAIMLFFLILTLTWTRTTRAQTP